MLSHKALLLQLNGCVLDFLGVVDRDDGDDEGKGKGRKLSDDRKMVGTAYSGTSGFGTLLILLTNVPFDTALWLPPRGSRRRQPQRR